MKNIEGMARVLHDWSSNIFGSIFKWKRNMSNRIRGVQRELESRSSDFLINLEKELIAEFEGVLNQ